MGFDIFAHSDQRVECNSQFIEYFGSNLTSTLETVFRETILSVKREGANAQNANCFNEIVEISITIGNVTSAERGSEIVLLLKNLPDIEFAIDLLDSEYGLVLRQLSVKMTVHGIEKESRSHRMQNIVFVLVVAGVTVFVVLLSAIISLSKVVDYHWNRVSEQQWLKSFAFLDDRHQFNSKVTISTISHYDINSPLHIPRPIVFYAPSSESSLERFTPPSNPSWSVPYFIEPNVIAT
ncbi:uncharacterized protein LOC134842447 [Symsagittifera roscoffensis]|uniref:uncharacterized protein LOC134842447 n=1 Tax=Symsagittifera roscoffensis TaxID=84072 RepID=UPI00307BF9D5